MFLDIFEVGNLAKASNVFVCAILSLEVMVRLGNFSNVFGCELAVAAVGPDRGLADGRRAGCRRRPAAPRAVG